MVSKNTSLMEVSKCCPVCTSISLIPLRFADTRLNAAALMNWGRAPTMLMIFMLIEFPLAKVMIFQNTQQLLRDAVTVEMLRNKSLSGPTQSGAQRGIVGQLTCLSGQSFGVFGIERQSPAAPFDEKFMRFALHAQKQGHFHGLGLENFGRNGSFKEGEVAQRHQCGVCIPPQSRHFRLRNGVEKMQSVQSGSLF